MKKQFINNFRYVSWIAIISSLCGSALLSLIGATKAYAAFYVYFIGTEKTADMSHLDTADLAINYMVKSLDTFLVALVLFIFAHGVFTLFIWDSENDKLKSFNVLHWIKTPNIGHLKNILAEVIIVILFVKFLELVLVDFDNLSWETLVLPIAILMLSLGLKFLGLAHDEKQPTNDDTE
ncbi:YqhA family protein [Vibrio sp. ZSDZ65]|uniref:YqhA family protein n=1 Tax=Vibrio qingdaonensis TaxID=2829491 RepID=A0A9X3CSU1_9VIBR|nr:YqhA family protein [Vibrio qingdaonensis]MCW8348871.1 YqhA family protein [Vibrio qingdaonensis]